MDIKKLSELSPGEIALQFPKMKDAFKKINIPFSLMDCDDPNVQKAVRETLENLKEYIEENELPGPQETSCSEMIRYILAKFHKRERQYIAETNTIISELDDEVANDPKFTPLKARWDIFADHHLAHFKEEEQFVFADLLKVDIFDKPDTKVQTMRFGSLTRPFMDLEKDHEGAINELGELTEEFLKLTELDKRFNIIWLNTKRLYLSVQDHIHYENFVLYPAALNLEAALCH